MHPFETHPDEKIQGLSVVVGGERSQDGLAAVMVVPDRGGQREESLQDSDGDALRAVAAVLFQAELAFQGVVDRFDDLAQRRQLVGAATGSFVLAGRANQFDAVVAKDAFELARDVALVSDERLAGAVSEQARVVVEHVDGDVAFVELGVGQSEGDRQPGWCAHEVQAQPPKRTASAMRSSRSQPRPASCERLVVGTDRLHSTGVESISQVSSAHTSVSSARRRIIACSCGAERRSRLL